KQPLNRGFYEGPDAETLDILIELGEIVRHSPVPEAKTALGDTEAAEAGLLSAAAGSISSIRALRVSRRAAKRLQEPAKHVPYDHRLPVFPVTPVDATLYTSGGSKR